MNWKTLQHSGIHFPPEHEVKGFKIKVKGKQVNLTPLQEEMAYQWAKKKDTPYAQDKVFQKNFARDFAKELGIKLLYKDLDFSEAYRLVDMEKDKKDMMTKEEKKEIAAKRKEIREGLKAKYGIAVMDGKEVEIASYMAEPPGIFIGRGKHPLRGKWKRRIGPQDVVLNMGTKAKAPPGKWKKIVHEKDGIWIAKWTDNLVKKDKYVWLADTAGLKQERDKSKYEKAVALSKKIGEIEAKIVKDMKSKDPKISKIATACYLIYRTAMRVGDEKDKDEADTVGATTLRKEHIIITDGVIEFDFLGKDSIRWNEKLKVTGDDEQFSKNLQGLVKSIKPTEKIFYGISSSDVNKYYSGIVPGVTAKVFRTYLASKKVSEYLRKNDKIRSKSAFFKLYHAKSANLKAAIMCNHKRTVPKTFKKALEKKKETLKKAKETKPKTDKQKLRKKERIEKLKLQIDLSRETRDYNVGTSLRNYIDPRIFKAWTDEVGAEWEKLYTTALQRKFLWVRDEKEPWKKVSKQY